MDLKVTTITDVTSDVTFKSSFVLGVDFCLVT